MPNRHPPSGILGVENSEYSLTLEGEDCVAGQQNPTCRRDADGQIAALQLDGDVAVDVAPSRRDGCDHGGAGTGAG